MILTEDFQDGRLKRKKGEFLCSQSKSKWGGNWSHSKYEPYFSYDGDHYTYTPIPSCKSCKKIMERYTNSSSLSPEKVSDRK